MVSGEFYGVIELFGREVRARDEEVVTIATEIGSQIGQFIARKEAESHLTFFANHDTLTGLNNRAMFNRRLTQALARARRLAKMAAVLFIDLDRFKVINDTLGHDAGDRLLKQLAERLRDCLREGDTIGRQGGDEFVVLIEDVADPNQVAGVGQKILETVARPYLISGQEFHVTASIGISIYPDDGHDQQALLEERRHRDVSRQGTGQEQPAVLFGADEPAFLRAAGARNQLAARGRAQRIPAALPAEGRYEERPHHRRRGAGALAASRTRHGAAGAVYSARRGNRPDRADRRVGAAHGVRRGAALGRAGLAADQRCGQSLAAPIRARRARGRHHAGTARNRPRPAPARARNHREHGDAQCRPRGGGAAGVESSSGCASRSTISAPATRR